ncbi:putative tail collar protein [Brucella phage S708]|uniref:Putative tail collar protein n=2 Tax=Perisivirus TaxID=1984798 RepID=X2CXI8_9CAUD|nr:putative tail collar protein [Brucella phage S708]AHB81371.1 putative tail collar protein [Brucella phage Wb]
MPRDSNGNTNPLQGTIVQTGDTILPSQHNPALVDLYAMMTQSLSRDGQGGMRANLAMNGFQVTGLGNATQPGNAVPLSQFQSGTPVGAVIDYAGVNPPNTWQFCFGQAIEVSAYPDFVAACYVGNALNATAGFGYRTTSQTDPSNNRSTSGQFIVLPDLRGRVGAGKDDMGGSAANRVTTTGSGINGALIGSNGGEQNSTLTIYQIPNHDHGGSTGNGVGSYTILNVLKNLTGNLSLSKNGQVGFTNENIPFSTHNHPISPQGGGLPHNNMQPTVIINKIIKVSY